MAILVNLDYLLQSKKMTAKELAEFVGITEANMSILRSGKARAVRFSTLNRICIILGCRPGDILVCDGKEYINGETENNE